MLTSVAKSAKKHTHTQVTHTHTNPHTLGVHTLTTSCAETLVIFLLKFNKFFVTLFQHLWWFRCGATRVAFCVFVVAILQKFSLVKLEKYLKLCFRLCALCAAATHTNCLPVGNEQIQLDGFGFGLVCSLDWLSKREREPHRTRAKNELKLNSNSPLARAELSWAGAGAAGSRRAEDTDEDGDDDEELWRLETCVVRVSVCVCVLVLVVRQLCCPHAALPLLLLRGLCWRCAASAAAVTLHGPFLAWTAETS